MVPGMVIDMNDAQMRTLDPLRAFLKATTAGDFSVQSCLAKKLDGAGRIARRDSAHVPGHCTPVLEIGCSDLEDASFCIFFSHRGENLRRDVLC
jgi:hypothetical protein